jgi:hypothetical protein
METTALASNTDKLLRHAVAALLAALALAAPRAGFAENVDVRIRWLQPEGVEPTGWVAHIGTEPGVYVQEIDLGAVQPNSTGRRTAYLALDSMTDYVVALSAYNAAGESPLSNEIAIAAAEVCEPAACDDGNPCTADTCEANACANVALEDGTTCLDGDAFGQCAAGVCEPAACIADEDCFAATDCAQPACVEGIGCMAVLQPDGTRCDDGLAWTKKDRCDAGVCIGKKRKGLRGKRRPSAS